MEAGAIPAISTKYIQHIGTNTRRAWFPFFISFSFLYFFYFPFLFFTFFQHWAVLTTAHSIFPKGALYG
jgi:hypothetical protein